MALESYVMNALCHLTSQELYEVGIISCPPLIDVEVEGQRRRVWSLWSWKWSHDPSQSCCLIRCARTALTPEQAQHRFKLGPWYPWLYRMISASSSDQGLLEAVGVGESANERDKNQPTHLPVGAMCSVSVRDSINERWGLNRAERYVGRKNVEAGKQNLFPGE